jgi:uncharacterized protein
MSAAGKPDESPRKDGVTCPTCGEWASWNANPHRPFCSVTCRLIDLGVWLDERYRLPTEMRDDDVS